MDPQSIVVTRLSATSEDNAAFSGRRKAESAAAAAAAETYSRGSTIGHGHGHATAGESRGGDRHKRLSLTAPLPAPLPSPFKPYSETSFSVKLETVLKKAGAPTTPGISPFQPYSQESFTTPMPKLLEKHTHLSSFSDCSNPDVHDSAQAKSKQTSAGKHAGEQWHALASPGSTSQGKKGASSRSFMHLFACFRPQHVRL